MEELSQGLRFEEAAVLRDRIHALELVIESQRVVGDPGDDLDAVGVWSDGEATEVSCLFVRSGLLVGKRDLLLSGGADPSTGSGPGSEAVERFLEEQYREGTAIPPRILLPLGMDFTRSWQELLTERAGRKVEVEQPARGKGYRLLSLAVANAKEALKSAEAGRESATALAAAAAGALHLPVPPLRIEAFDVSHTAGREAYASCVCWREGALAKGDYRLFSLRETDPGDDFAGLAEAITRRLTGSLAGELPPPDLLLIDGGKGQLSRVTGLLASLGKGDLPAVSISKARTEKRRRPGQGVADEVWLPGRANPLRLPGPSPVLRLLQLLRDEAHRFALAGHRRRRGRQDLTSALDGIPGVGPARRKALLTRFRSLAEIAGAREEDIAATPGLNLPLARAIKSALGTGGDLG
jgi:excinuclease ABC subunit C